MYITKTASGLVWSGSTATGRLSYSGTIEHIGGKYFVTNQGVLSWETSRLTRANTDINNFVGTCANIEWKYGVFSCPKTLSIITESGKYMTGILDISSGFIAQSGSITELDNGTLGKTWNQTGSIDLTRIVSIDGMLYSNNSGTLTPQNLKEEKIFTTLDSITHLSSLGDDIISVGIK